MNVLKLRKLLDQTGKPITLIEKEAGLKPRSIWPILNGTVKKPHDRTLRGLADSLGYEYDDFLDKISGNDAAYLWDADLYSEIVNIILSAIKTHGLVISYEETHAIINELIDELYRYSYQSKKVDKDACEMLIRVALRNKI